MSPNKLRLWETIERRTILHPNKFLKVESHTVKLPDGKLIEDWTWLEIPSAVVVLAVTGDQRFLCFRQTKYAVEGTSLAPVGGMLEPGEAPLEAAKRELLEEMGCEALEWVNLGSYVVDPNRGIAKVHCFLAINAQPVANPNSDDLEDQELLVLGRNEIEIALRAGEFKVLAWSTVVSLALNYLDKSTAQKASEYSGRKGMEEIEDFVQPYYTMKDGMHDLSHVRRILKCAQNLGADQQYDHELLQFGAYFHGIVSSRESEILEFLKQKGVSLDRMKQAVQIARESLKDRRPETFEGVLLHDAHLIEGGETFIITKSLVTGTARGHSLEETIEYIEHNILGKFKCYLPKAQRQYEEKEKFAREFLDSLKHNLATGL